ncbi:hypothetical protein DEU56DRAFT_919324 [Suillus clintonianus]|uniref:uncharacterized protein n=1 Tax=Suillus clintonianus TaxID=1904413 RepID=UPI001B866640|nr:uncharacterized protein DEU56DRAFT_919324 [Suillus clintonianus]KAG2116146.1 hypothetical protein DEU56DRAFT_919324 [Suillus clintonianus]
MEEDEDEDEEDEEEQNLMLDMVDVHFGDCLPLDEENGVLKAPSKKFFMLNEDKRPEGEVSILRLLSENKIFVHPPVESMTFSMPYTRFKFVWLKAAKTARTEHRDYGSTFSADGQAVNVPDSTSTFHVVKFNQLGSIARDVINNFTTTIQSVLPSHCGTLYEEFSTLEITDDLGCRQSIFQQQKNQPLLQPLVQTLYDQLVAANKGRAGLGVIRRNGTVDEKAIKKLLDREQNILSLFNMAFHLSCGVPPRPFQLKSFQYDLDADTGRERNLFIVWGVLALANPAAKQLGIGVQECLWAFPSSLMTPVLFYFGVLRPVFSKLLGLLRSNAKEHSIYIFVHTIPKRKKAGNLWNGTDVNASLQKYMHSLPITLTGTLLHNLTTGMLRKFLPSLTELDNLPNCLLDQQAQHSRQTGNTHYGQDFDLP